MNKDFFRKMHNHMIPDEKVVSKLKNELHENESMKMLPRVYHVIRPLAISFCCLAVAILIIFTNLSHPAKTTDIPIPSNSSPSPMPAAQTIKPHGIYHNIQLPNIEFGTYIDLISGFFLEERLITYAKNDNNNNYLWSDSASTLPLSLPVYYLPEGDYTTVYKNLKDSSEYSSEASNNPSKSLAHQVNYVYFNKDSLDAIKCFKFFRFSTDDLALPKIPKENMVTLSNGNIQLPKIQLANEDTNTPLNYYLFFQNGKNIIGMEAEADPSDKDAYEQGDVNHEQSDVNHSKTRADYHKIIEELQILMAAAIEQEIGDKPSLENDLEQSTFNENYAITSIINKHPDFPSNPSLTITKFLSTGGPGGTTAKVSFNTSTEKISASEYDITLTKDWRITFGTTYVKSVWKYRVTPQEVELIDFIDHEDLPMMMK